MKIKKGDSVIVKAGKNKGTSGVIVRVFPKKELVLIEGVSIVKRHQKARRGGAKGQIIEKAMPIHISNVMISDPKKNTATRIKISRENGKRIRIAKVSGAVIDK